MKFSALAVILQEASGHVKGGQVGTIYGALQEHQELRNNFLYIISHEYLVAVELYLPPLQGFELDWFSLGKYSIPLRLKG